MTLRSKRLQALQHDVRRALEAIERDATAPAQDGWLGPARMLDACRSAEPLVFRAALPLEAGRQRRTPIPVEPRWVRSDGGPELREVAMRGGAVRSLRATKVRLEPVRELCCDAPKCAREKLVGELWIEIEGAGEAPKALLVAERLGDDEAVASLGALGEALAERLDVLYEGATGPSPAAKGEPLDALGLSRWSLRREGDHFVLRDHAQHGPREGVPREVAILLAMTLAFGAAWYGTYQAYLAQSWTTVAIFGATALVMTFFVITMAQIVRHSMAYRADHQALLWLARDCLVMAPWHDRDGAVDVGSAGRYGAGVGLGELEAVRLLEEPGGWSLRLETAHGPFEVGVIADRALAERWRDALVDLARDVAHGELELEQGGGGRRAPAVAALVLLAGMFSGCATPPPATATAEAAPPPPSASAPAAASPPSPPPTTASAAAAPAPTPTDRLGLIEDDMARATAQAKGGGKALFVEVWAPWCHTCLSMKQFVLPDPALRPLRDRVVFAAIDSDRPANAAFMDRYAVSVWPTLFVIDPSRGEVVSLWQGAASVEELRGFVQDALDAMDAKHDPAGPLAALIEGKAAHAEGRWAQAATAYQRAIDRGGEDWPRRSEALAGLIFVEYRQGHWLRCAKLGADHAAEIEGAAVPADFAWVALDCAEEVPAPALAAAARRAVLARLKRHTDDPPASASVDDRSDALNIYAGALASAGDRSGARAAREKQIALLEAAADAAPDPETASTFDYARMGALLALGRGEEAVSLFQRRREQLPDRYEPPARLAQTLMALGRNQEALEPLRDAVAKSYGPRQVRYLETLAELQAKLGDRRGRAAALRQLLTAHAELSDAQRRQPRQAARAEAARQQLRALGVAVD